MRYVNMSVEGEKSGSKHISNEDKKRFEDLFNLLDTNKDGTVDIQELTAALKGRREPSNQAQVLTCVIVKAVATFTNKYDSGVNLYLEKQQDNITRGHSLK